MTKPTVYVDMDGVLCDYADISKTYRARTPGNQFPQASYGFFSDMKPLPGAIEAYHWLAENYDTCILTRPSVLNPLCYTEKRVWVEKHLGIEACETLILCTQKWRLIGDYLIDDMPWPKFKGTQIAFGDLDYPNWTVTLDYFQMKRMELDYPGCELRRRATLDGDGGTFISAIKNGQEVACVKM